MIDTKKGREMPASKNNNQKHKYLKQLLVALMVVGMLGMYVIPNHFAYAGEDYPAVPNLQAGIPGQGAGQGQEGAGDELFPGDDGDGLRTARAYGVYRVFR